MAKAATSKSSIFTASIRAIYVVAVMLSGLALSAWGQNLILSPTKVRAAAFKGDIAILIDSGASFKLPQVVSPGFDQPWTSATSVATRIQPHANIWFRIIIESEQAQTIFIEHPWNMVISDVIMHANDLRFQRLRKHAPLFSIDLPSGSSTIYLQLVDVESRWFKANLQLMTAEMFVQRQTSDNDLKLFFFGAPISMMLLTLAAFTAYQHSYFIYYIAYVLSFLAILAIGSFHLPNAWTFLWPSLLIFNAFATQRFVADFLQLKTIAPRLHKSMIAMVIIYAFMAILERIQEYETYAYVTQIAVYMTAVIAAIVALRHKIQGAGWLVAGWAILAVSLLINVLSLRFSLSTPMYLSVYAGFAAETILFAIALVVETKKSETLANAQNQHAIKQLAKVFYPHQISQIRAGKELEATMPVGDSEACVLVFDIVNSSKIRHEHVNAFFENIFHRCNDIMNRSYDAQSLTANAYRIKEMGDGFICSIGFPFRSPNASKAQTALNLALEFHAAFAHEVACFAYHEPITCCMGIAMDRVSGYFPAAGPKAYDLFGRGIILATRYEAMRKSLTRSTIGRSLSPNKSLLILQEKVFSSLAPEQRKTFQKLKLADENLTVRDDSDAAYLFIRELETYGFKQPDSQGDNSSKDTQQEKNLRLSS